jgi:Flp pilus assembly pilin Flp
MDRLPLGGSKTKVGRDSNDVGILLTHAAHEPGQDVVDYGILIATIAVLVLIGTLAFGNRISPWFESLAARITTVGT